MGWSIGSDGDRDIGYGVPAVCDHPDCTEEIDRGLSYVCGSEPYGGGYGCGLFFCEEHRNFKEVKNKRTIRVPGEETIFVELCDRCYDGEPPFEPKPDVEEWIRHKLTDESWQRWRDENTEEVEKLKSILEQSKSKPVDKSIDGEPIPCPFCQAIDNCLKFPGDEIICGNPECRAYPRIKSRSTAEIVNKRL
jgi:hypothetical protein